MYRDNSVPLTLHPGPLAFPLIGLEAAFGGQAISSIGGGIA